MGRQLDLIFRLFCLGQLFECIRPYVWRGVGAALDAEGVGAALGVFFGASPPARWLVYGVCLSIVFAGPRRSLVVALAGAHLADVAASLWTNSLSSGYAEKGILVFFTLGAAGLVVLDPGEREARIARLRSLLRWISAIGFAAIALHKLNADFLDPATSCSAVLTAGLFERLPFLEPVMGPLAGSPWASFAMEALLLPTLLVNPRLGALYAWVFFTGVAQVGPRATCFVFMTFALCFLPPADFEASPVSRRTLQRVAAAAAVFATLFWTVALGSTLGVSLVQLLPRAGFLTLALTGLFLLAANLRRTLDADRAASPAFRGAPRPAAVVAVVVVALFALNELAPYLGLKTKYSLTMWSNLRADAGRSNSFVFPEVLRVSGAVDRALLLVPRIEPRRAVAGGVPPVVPFVASHRSALAHLRRLEAERGPLRFGVVWEGALRSFEGAGPDSAFARFVAETLPRVDAFDGRVMTLGRPQRCLGP